VDFEELLPEGIDKKILIEKTGNATEFFLLANNNYSANDLIFSKEPLSFDRVINTESYLLQKEKILGKNRFPKVYELDIDLDEKSLFPHIAMNEHLHMSFAKRGSLKKTSSMVL
jgi:serine/threonine-protein kinase HipA